MEVMEMAQEERKVSFYTTTQLAEMAGVDQSRIRQVILEGVLIAYKTGRDWLIPRDLGDQWLAAREEEQRAADALPDRVQL